MNRKVFDPKEASMPDTIEKLLQLLESTANMLRGMTLDPAIPKRAKDAMWWRISEIEKVVASHA